MDYESIELANNPQFLAILAEARASYEREGGIASEEVRKLFEKEEDEPRKSSHLPGMPGEGE
jgi:hypothetical protein